MPPERRSQTGSSPAARDKFSSSSAAALALSSRRTGEGLSYDEQVTRELQEAGDTLLYQEPRPDGGPRRPMNAFLIYARWRRMQMAKDSSRAPLLLSPLDGSPTNIPATYSPPSPGDGTPGSKKRKKGPKPSDISAALGDEWTRLSTAAQRPFHAKANELRAEFDAAHPEYKFTRGPKGAAKQRRLEKQRMMQQQQGGMAMEMMGVTPYSAAQHHEAVAAAAAGVARAGMRRHSDVSAAVMPGTFAPHHHPEFSWPQASQARYADHHQQQVQQPLLHLNQLRSSPPQVPGYSVPMSVSLAAAGPRYSLASQGVAPDYFAASHQHHGIYQPRLTSLPMGSSPTTLPTPLASTNAPWPGHHYAASPQGYGRQRSLSGQRMPYAHHSQAHPLSSSPPQRQSILVSSSSAATGAAGHGHRHALSHDANGYPASSHHHPQQPRAGYPPLSEVAPLPSTQVRRVHQRKMPAMSGGDGGSVTASMSVADLARSPYARTHGLHPHQQQQHQQETTSAASPTLPAYSRSPEETRDNRLWLGSRPMGRARALSLRSMQEQQAGGGEAAEGVGGNWPMPDPLRSTYQTRGDENEGRHARGGEGWAASSAQQAHLFSNNSTALYSSPSYAFARGRTLVRGEESAERRLLDSPRAAGAQANGRGEGYFVPPPAHHQGRARALTFGSSSLLATRNDPAGPAAFSLPAIQHSRNGLGPTSAHPRDYEDSQELAPLRRGLPQQQRRRGPSPSIALAEHAAQHHADSSVVIKQEQEDDPLRNSTLARFASVAAGVDSRCQTAGAIDGTAPISSDAPFYPGLSQHHHHGLPEPVPVPVPQVGQPAITSAAASSSSLRPQPSSTRTQPQPLPLRRGNNKKITDDNPFAFAPPDEDEDEDDDDEEEEEDELAEGSHPPPIESRHLNADEDPAGSFNAVQAAMSFLFGGHGNAGAGVGTSANANAAAAAAAGASNGQPHPSRAQTAHFPLLMGSSPNALGLSVGTVGRESLMTAVPQHLDASAAIGPSGSNDNNGDADFYGPLLGTSHSEPWYAGAGQFLMGGTVATAPTANASDPFYEMWQQQRQGQGAGLSIDPTAQGQHQHQGDSIDTALLSAPATATATTHPPLPLPVPAVPAVPAPPGTSTSTSGGGGVPPGTSHSQGGVDARNLLAHYDAASVLDFWKTPPGGGQTQLPSTHAHGNQHGSPSLATRTPGLKPRVSTAAGLAGGSSNTTDGDELTLTSPLSNALQLEGRDASEADKRLAVNNEIVARAVVAAQDVTAAILREEEGGARREGESGESSTSEFQMLDGGRIKREEELDEEEGDELLLCNGQEGEAVGRR